MQIQVNGKTQSIEDGSCLTDLLQILELNPKQVAIEVNLQLVPREQHHQHELKDGDNLEIVTLVGGG